MPFCLESIFGSESQHAVLDQRHRLRLTRSKSEGSCRSKWLSERRRTWNRIPSGMSPILPGRSHQLLESFVAIRYSKSSVRCRLQHGEVWLVSRRNLDPNYKLWGTNIFSPGN